MRKAIVAILIMTLVALAVTAVLVVPLVQDSQTEKIVAAPGASDFHQRHPNWTWDVPEGASDFYQRHPDWTWAVSEENLYRLEPGYLDYYHRHKD